MSASARTKRRRQQRKVARATRFAIWASDPAKMRVADITAVMKDALAPAIISQMFASSDVLFSTIRRR